MLAKTRLEKGLARVQSWRLNRKNEADFTSPPKSDQTELQGVLELHFSKLHAEKARNEQQL